MQFLSINKRFSFYLSTTRNNTNSPRIVTERRSYFMKHQVLFVEDGIAIIRLKGELDHHATQLIRDEISQSLYRGTLRAIIWNLQDLQFMDSAGIGLILGRMRDFVPTNGQTVILHPSETMKKIFQYSGLGSYVWPTTEEETIAELGGILNGQ